MLVTTKLRIQTSLLRTVFCIATLLAGCGRVAPASTVTARVTSNPTQPVSSTISSPVSTVTSTATVIPLPTCTPIPKIYIYVIDRATYLDVDAGLELGLGPSGAIAVLQEALDEHHPDWGQEEGLAKNAWNYSHAQNIGVNPRALLVTTGVALDWQIPEDHDLKEDIIQTGVALTQSYREFRFNEELQAKYPQVANAASYALYAFFDYDLEKLEVWQQEYDRMFGDVQPRIIPNGCITATSN
ncbi:MAG: hypothetical protein QY306_07330 [Anaerolineales bacterium]|nr:MAG: hypothetical protein QY306_07330 [Anaerolineales bacterium]